MSFATLQKQWYLLVLICIGLGVFSSIILVYGRMSRECPVPEPVTCSSLPNCTNTFDIPACQVCKSCPDCPVCLDCPVCPKCDQCPPAGKRLIPKDANSSPNMEGSVGTLPHLTLEGLRNDAALLNGIDDLIAYSALSETSILKRLRRLDQFHFAVEHDFWDPKTEDELRWSYITSQGYLFGNVIHSTQAATSVLGVDQGPVLDFSGGVGNNCIYLAKKGVHCHYFGIGTQEREFAKFRVRRHNLADEVTFIDPWKMNSEGDLVFSDLPEPEDGVRFKAIMAYDVFEHIPNYARSARHLVSLLEVGGLLFEQSPFNEHGTDVSIHQKLSVPMKDAVGPNCKQVNFNGLGAWNKTRELLDSEIKYVDTK